MEDLTHLATVAEESKSGDGSGSGWELTLLTTETSQQWVYMSKDGDAWVAAHVAEIEATKEVSK